MRPRFLGKTVQKPPAFEAAWVMSLTVTLPVIKITAGSITELEKELRRYLQLTEMVAMYFLEGKYVVDRDGSLQWLSGNPEDFSEYPQIRVTVKFENFPPADSIPTRANAIAGILLDESCVLNIPARGVERRPDGTEILHRFRFCTSDGEIIIRKG